MAKAKVNEQSLPGRFPVIVAAARRWRGTPSTPRIPAGSPGRCAAAPTQTRYYPEIPVTDTAADWPEQRVRNELTARLGIGRRLDVPLGEMGILDLRVRVIEPMQQGSLFLAGDASHLITPAGNADFRDR